MPFAYFYRKTTKIGKMGKECSGRPLPFWEKSIFEFVVKRLRSTEAVAQLIELSLSNPQVQGSFAQFKWNVVDCIEKSK